MTRLLPILLDKPSPIRYSYTVIALQLGSATEIDRFPAQRQKFAFAPSVFLESKVAGKALMKALMFVTSHVTFPLSPLFIVTPQGVGEGAKGAKIGGVSGTDVPLISTAMAWSAATGNDHG
jgi:hypothetical protein